jgi:hypothetical protein
MRKLIATLLTLLWFPASAAEFSSTQWTKEVEGTITYAANVFTLTITGYELVRFPSTTAGVNVDLNLRNYSYTFNDAGHGSDHLTDMGFGVTETVDWAQDVPFFIYLVNEDNTAANVGAFITKDPRMGSTPAAAKIHDKDAAGATDTQESIFGMWTDDAGKAAKPCVLIGAIRMRWDTTNDSWTIQALGNNDGIGKDRLAKTFGTVWTFPLNQHGAAAGTYMLDNGGNAPVFGNNAYTYNLSADGQVQARIRMSTDGGQDGVGAVTCQISMPYGNALANDSYTSAFMVNETTNGDHLTVAAATASLNTYFRLTEGLTAVAQNADFGNGARMIRGTLTYQAFND